MEEKLILDTIFLQELVQLKKKYMELGELISAQRSLKAAYRCVCVFS